MGDYRRTEVKLTMHSIRLGVRWNRWGLDVTTVFVAHNILSIAFLKIVLKL